MGEFSLCFFDAEGRPVKTPLSDRVIGISREELARCERVLALAGGRAKTEAIRGALKTGVIDLLITDKFTAARLVGRSHHSLRRKRMLRRFEGKTVVITGGNRGIGLAIARRFGREGANVVIGSVDADLPQARAALEAEGIATRDVTCDVTDKAAVKRLYDSAEDAFGAVDVSIQNAGIITIARVENLTEREWDATMT